MLIITIQVDAPTGQAIGVKEDLAQYLERYGDARVVSITEELPEQLRFYKNKIQEDQNYGKETGRGHLPRF